MFFHSDRLTQQCGTYDAGVYGQTPYVEAVTVWNEEAREVTVFAVNRNLEEDIPLDVEIGGLEGLHKLAHRVLTNDDMKAVNTADCPDTVSPIDLPLTEETVLPKHSWNVIRFGY